jgi:4-hydroxy-2-oxoheptanedioate aldolase
MIPSPLVSEFLGVTGFDYVCIDCQHGLIGYDAMVPMLQSMARTGAMPVVRVPGNDPYWIGQALDAGAEAVIVPMVSTRAEAERAAAACRYFPDGTRSFGPVRAGMFLPGTPAEVNEKIVCLVMIETEAGVEAADEICSTPGIDGIYVGPADLSVTLGVAMGWGRSGDDSRLIEALTRVVSACKASGIIPGIHTGNLAQAKRARELGFEMVTVATDVGLLRAAAAEQLAAVRGD